MPRRETCQTRYGTPEVSGSLEESALTEASGIVASPGNPGVLWVHNDSGNVPAIYALAEDGRAIGRASRSTLLRSHPSVRINRSGAYDRIGSGTSRLSIRTAQ